MVDAVSIHGRGAAQNPANRFEPLHFEPDPEAAAEESPSPVTEFLRDTSRTIIARNDSPDVGFEFSVNPYRGCEHGCIYCYARPFHEYLGFSAGLDFETKILVKEDTPTLLRRELSSPRWRPEVIALSGVTDPYQPIERRLRLTRGCLEALRDFRNPVVVVTKNHLVTRDVDVLAEMASREQAAICVSITTLDGELQRIMEPRASPPTRRLAAIEELTRAGVPVSVLAAPVIPALTDHEIPSILMAAARAGARSAGYVLLRLPHAVASLFDNWLTRHFPDRREKILNRLREMRGGALYDARYFARKRGEGLFADQIEDLFDLGCHRAGLDRDFIPLQVDDLRARSARQLQLL
jgi:DNA repair photolyase